MAYFIMILICISLMADDAEHLFMYIITVIHIFSFLKDIFKFVSLLLNVEIPLYILNARPFFRYVICKYLSQLVACNRNFVRAKVLNFDGLIFINFFLCVSCFGVMLKNSLPNFWTYLLCFLLMPYSFTFRSIIQLS